MSETDDDLNPLGNGGRFDPVAALRKAARNAPAVVGSIVGIVVAVMAGWTAIKQAAFDAQARAQAAKDLAEDGYQKFRHTVDAMNVELAALRLAVARRPPEPAPTRRGPKSAPRRPAPLAALPPPVPPLPPTLDAVQTEARKLRQQNLRLVTPPAAPSPDAAP